MQMYYLLLVIGTKVNSVKGGRNWFDETPLNGQNYVQSLQVVGGATDTLDFSRKSLH
jgi:hypothetical protein